MNPPAWWQTTTIYQVYPRSFADANGDGIGDLRGLIGKLDYLRDLGFETLWVSPFFRSPQRDFGYDVSDYCDIAPEYGTLADAEALIAAAHARGMRILFDLVLNHTSTDHPWFQESRRSREDPRRDWYIWQPGRGKRPPNNWKAIPGGPGWHFDAPSGEYYYANFLDCQPDLNWRNPAVQQAMLEMIRFWLGRGVDGFRLDIFHSVFKHPDFPDNPFSWEYLPREDQAGYFQQFKYNLNQPETLELARQLRRLGAKYTPERMWIGEVFGSREQQKRFLGEMADGLNLIFLWDLLRVKGQADFLRRVIAGYERDFPPPYTPVYVFGNHDRRRLRSQAGGDLGLARLLAFFQFTVRGVPVTYYGEEIGMEDGDFPARNALDPIGQRYAWVPPWLARTLGIYVNRDGCRTPMQWEPGPQAGFCPPGVTPWLPLHTNCEEINVQRQSADPHSLLNLYRALLRLRKHLPSLHSGNLTLETAPADVLAYTRRAGDQSALAAINFGRRAARLRNPLGTGRIFLFTGASPALAPTVSAAEIEIPPRSALLLAE